MGKSRPRSISISANQMREFGSYFYLTLWQVVITGPITRVRTRLKSTWWMVNFIKYGKFQAVWSSHGCSWILISSGIFLGVFDHPFLYTPTAPITTGIVVAFIFHIHPISFFRSFYLDSFSFTLIEVFLSVGMALSISIDSFFFFFILDHGVWFISFYLTIFLYWYFLQDRDVTSFRHCLGLLFVLFSLFPVPSLMILSR